MIESEVRAITDENLIPNRSEGPRPDPPTIRLADGYHFPRLIVGGWQLSSGHHVESTNKEDVLAAFSDMADAGLTAFDCADIYTGVEELLGEFLRRYRERAGQPARTPVRIHTKFVPDSDVLPNISKAYTERIIDRSLRRLGVERLDLVQFGWWDYDVPRYVETACWLHELMLAGKIHQLGATNFDVPRLTELVDAGVPIVTHQVQYSLLDHRVDRGMVELCRERKIQLLCYGTLAGGFLSGKWLGLPEPRAALPNRSLTKYKLIIDEFGGWTAFQELLGVVHDIAAKHAVGIGNVATRYVLDRPQVGAVIVGARSGEHFRDNLSTLGLALDEDDTSTLRGLTAHRGPAGDVYSLEREADGVHAAIMRYNLNRSAPDNSTAVG